MQNNNWFQQELVKYGIDLGLLLSGFFGALILTINRKKQKISRSIASIFAGTICANYLTPLILSFMTDSFRERGKYAVAFMMGYMGLRGLEILIDFGMAYIETKKLDKK